MIEIRQIKLPAGTPRSALDGKIKKKLRLQKNASVKFQWQILRHSVDARKKPELFDVYNVGVQIMKCDPARVPATSGAGSSEPSVEADNVSSGAPASAVSDISASESSASGISASGSSASGSSASGISASGSSASGSSASESFHSDALKGGTPYTESEERRLVARLHDPNVRITEPVVYQIPPVRRTSDLRPYVIGMGPAGLFCALTLARAGLRPVVLERGQAMEQRIRDVEHFWETGELDASSNIQFGEGGAGTFSDGKLTTNVRDRTGKNRAVLEDFVKAGAHEDILYENLPHIGTDVLRRVVVNLREEIIKLGGEVRFGCRVTGFHVRDGKLTGLAVRDHGEDLIFPCDAAALAIGHSARDTFRALCDMNLPMTPKNFAVGFRVSHPQSLINGNQYGISDENILRKMNLPAASYKLTAQTERRGVYTFCMCPGGYVVNASSENGRLAVNGMSDYARDSGRANSAVVMTVTPEDFGSDGVLAGMHFQERLEEEAFKMADGDVPVEKWTDFERRFSEKTYSEAKSSDNPDAKAYTQASHDPAPAELPQRTHDFSSPELSQGSHDPAPAELPQRSHDPAPSALSRELCIRGASRLSPLHELLPESMTEDFITGMKRFDRTLPGFAGDDAWVIGLESRTSSPVRILRDAHGESAVRGLYPCGEGAGYAGGIMSAAIDGMKIAEYILQDDR